MRSGPLLRLLGGVEARRDGHRVPLGPARQQCVLVALALEANTAVPTDHLVERVWGEHAPLRARATLQTYLTRLRRVLAVLGDVAISWRSGSYVLSVDESAVDVHLFRRLTDRARATEDDEEAAGLYKRALGLWRGEAFPGLDSPWLAAARTTLENERMAVESACADAELRLGRHAALLPVLHTRADDRPLDERIAAQLMLALYRDGRQADALLRYQSTRSLLVEEMGTDPSPVLEDLHQQILTADPEVTGSPPDPDPAPDGPAAPPPVTPLPAPADASSSLQLAIWMTRANIDREGVQRLRVELTAVENSYVYSEPQSVLQDLVVLHRRIAALLHGRQRPGQTRALLVLDAKCCAMLACLSADLGRYDAAKEYGSAGWQFAEHADDDQARRWVRAAQSRVLFWSGNPLAAARVAADGLRLPGDGPSEAFLVLQEARGWGAVGAAAEATDALRRWERGPAGDGAGFFDVTRDRQCYVAGRVLLDLGRTDRALEHFRGSQVLHDELPVTRRWPVMDAMIRIDTCRTHLRAGEADGALEVLEPVLEALEPPAFDMVRVTLDGLRADLDTPRWRGGPLATRLAGG